MAKSGSRAARVDRPEPSSRAAQARMRATRREGTAAERELVRVVRKSGLRGATQYKLPGLTRRTADLAFPRPRVAVFVDGCFWHGCPVHGTAARANADYWSRKIAENRARDRATTRHLRGLDWIVLRFWEHEVQQAPAKAVMRIDAALLKATRPCGTAQTAAELPARPQCA